MFRIEEILKERGLTKKAFGDLIGTSKQNVNALLKNPTLNKLETIANALEIPIWQLFVSPNELSENKSDAMSDFIALIKQGGELYSASSIAEARDVLDKLENKKEGK